MDLSPVGEHNPAIAHPRRAEAPAVSVIVPAWNAAAYIADALESIVAQTLQAVEVLVVDDGSSDGTIGTAESFADRLDLTVLRQSNRGPSAARNAGIRHARAPYCAFLDADDVMLPDLLATQLAALQADPAVGLVLSDIETFDQHGTIDRARWGLSRPAADAALERLLVENYVTTSAVMAPTSRLIEAGLFPENRRVAEDYELWLRLASRWRVAFIDRSLVRYRYTGGSLSSDKVYSATCALDVVETFWREHPEYRHDNPDVHHASLARHCTNAASAAASQGRRRLALSHLTRALRHAPLSLSAWKLVVKTLLPVRRPSTLRPGAAA